MAPKKKADMDVKKAKDIMNSAAQIVNERPMYPGAEWDQTIKAVDALDKEFNFNALDEEENFVDVLKNKFRHGDVEVRVMQVGRDGRLTDVSDKIKPKDLRPESIEGVQTGDGRMVPITAGPQNRAEALRLLQELLPGLKLSKFDPTRGGATAESIKRMELVLAESDKILEHWKK